MSNVEKLVGNLVKSRKYFFHFTNHRKIPLIRETGLVSMRNQRQRKRTAIAPGGNDWSLDADKRCCMDAFVYLCFFSEHPMEWSAKQEGRIEKSVFLKNSPLVLNIAGTLIVDTVSNRADAQPKPAEEMISQLDLEVIYTRPDWKDPAVQERLKIAKKYEILVPDLIPLELISGL
jgi:hypothetical protein